MKVTTPPGMVLTGYHPRVGLPTGPDGRLLLTFQFAPAKGRGHDMRTQASAPPEPPASRVKREPRTSREPEAPHSRQSLLI